MMYASLTGRLRKDPQEIATQSGKPMTAASVAVDVSPRDAEATVWIRVLCFGKLAELLAAHAKGDTLAACGRLELSKWTATDGTERESWQLIADALHSARTAAKGKRTAGDKAAPPHRQPTRTATAGAAPDFNDPMPF